jgi:restriction system protein
MKSLDAAEQVLAESAIPLHYRDITKQILERGLWTTKGKTPEATVAANLSVDISRHGAESRFQRMGKGVYALRAWGLLEDSPQSEQDVNPEPPGEEVAPQKPPSQPPTTLTFTNAAEVILEKHGSKKPMHYRDITDKILELDLVHTEGQTPEATLYASIGSEIKRNLKRGETPRFVMHGKGYVGLRKWMGEGLAFQIRQHNAEVRKKLLARLRKMPWEDFEALVAQLFVAMGFEVTKTEPRGDRGIDVRGTLVVGDVIRTRMAVQVKKWKKNIQAPVVQQVRGSLGAHEQGLIITTSDFSQGAVKEAERPDATPVALMNGEQLVALLLENDIGVQRASHDLIELEEAE